LRFDERHVHGEDAVVHEDVEARESDRWGARVVLPPLGPLLQQGEVASAIWSDDARLAVDDVGPAR
jgi:hypothetical protein